MVLIARNQERTIGRLIESVLRETAAFSPREVILVDSASSDRTVEIALDHRIGVLGLPEREWLCPAAGRYAGFAWTTGGSVLFLDGDMELCAGWLAAALQFLERLPRVAAVAGRVIDADAGTDALPVDPLRPLRFGSESAWEIPHPGGAALYRRAVLEEVGSFNPHLRSDEEPELAFRLRERGYQIIALNRPSVVHYQPVASGAAALLARRQRGLFVGHGQVARLLLGHSSLRLFLRERGYFLVPLAAGTAGALAGFRSLATRKMRWIGGWALLVAGVLGAVAVRRRSIKATALASLNRLLFLEGFVRGVLKPDRDPRTHPVLAEAHWVRSPSRARRVS